MLESSTERHYVIVDLVRSITRKEEKAALKWINRSNTSLSNTLGILFQVLRKTSNKAEIWKKIFPDTEYLTNNTKQNQVIRNLFSSLKKELEDFLVFHLISTESIKRDLVLLKELDKRQLNKDFRSLHKKTQKKLDNHKSRSFIWFRWKYELETLYQEHLQKTGKDVKGNPLGEAIRMYDISWILETLLIEISRLDYNKRGEKIPLNASFSEKLDYFLSLVYLDPDYWNSPLISLFDTIRKTYTDFTVDLLYLWNSYKESYFLLENETAVKLFFAILNLSVISSKQTAPKEYYARLIEQYRWGIKLKYILLDGILAPQHYKNYITCCIHLNEFKEAEIQIKSLQKLLPKEEQAGYHNFCLGFLLFKQKEFRKSFTPLSKTFSDKHLEIQARLIIAQSRYELQDDFDYDRHFNALKAFVRSQKLQKHEKDGYLNRIILFSKLLKTDLSALPKRQLLHQEISKTSPIYNPEWLLSKTKNNTST